MKTSTLLAGLMLGLAPLSSAPAQDRSDGRIFENIDANGDGVITRNEAGAARDRLFARLDHNSDGVIDDDEIEEARDAIMDRADATQARLGTAWRRMDANGDGKVSVDEFRSRAALFDLADRNADGKLSSDEIAFIRNLVASRRG